MTQYYPCPLPLLPSFTKAQAPLPRTRTHCFHRTRRSCPQCRDHSTGPTAAALTHSRHQGRPPPRRPRRTRHRHRLQVELCSTNHPHPALRLCSTHRWTCQCTPDSRRRKHPQYHQCKAWTRVHFGPAGARHMSHLPSQRHTHRSASLPRTSSDQLDWSSPPVCCTRSHSLHPARSTLPRQPAEVKAQCNPRGGAHPPRQLACT